MIFVTYLAETQSSDNVDKLIEQTKQLSTEVGGQMDTVTETWSSQIQKKKEVEKKLD